MTRVSEVIDCWFDSGAMPFAQYHYPFENKEFFDAHYPSDFISEALDQTRGWFYSLLAIGTQLFDQAPFRNCIVMGLVQDKEGIKMSKHKGNVVDPWDVLNKQGADAARWYFYSANAPWLPSRFAESTVSESQRKFMGTFWNTYAFYVMYASIDGFEPSQYKLVKALLPAMDRWVLSRMHSLIAQVDTKMTEYDITGASRLMQDFVDELSNWYVRRNRERYWGSEMTQDKINAYMTLYTVLDAFTRVAAPFVPFMTESIYQNLIRGSFPDAPISVHLCDFPVSDAAWIDENLETQMDVAQHIVFMGRACRNMVSIKNRQPLSKLYVVAPRILSDEYIDIIKEELNIRTLVYLKDAAELLDYRFKPQLRTLGKKLGSRLNEAKNIIAHLPGRETMKLLLENGCIHLFMDGEDILLDKEDLLVENVQPEGLSTQSDRDYTVSLDTTLTDELIEDGFVREIISKVQTQRKESGFDVTDRIRLCYSKNDRVASVIAAHTEFIAEEVLATEIVAGEGGNPKEWDINGEICVISVEKIAKGDNEC